MIMKAFLILYRLGIASALLGMALPLAKAAEAVRPNFIIIFCDDLGYADIGPFGSEKHRTPHLDRLASAGETKRVDLASLAARWVSSDNSDVSERQWRAAAKKLGAPTRRLSHAELVATVIGYQVAGGNPAVHSDDANDSPLRGVSQDIIRPTPLGMF